MLNWSRVEVTTSFKTGEQTVSYSHTAAEFIDELKQREGCIYVTKGSCAECHYTPDRVIPQEAVQKTTVDDALAYHRIIECHCGAIARFKRMPDVPEFIVCYGFYYQFVHRNKYLLAAKEAGLITFYDVSNLPTLRESGLKVYPDYFDTMPR